MEFSFNYLMDETSETDRLVALVAFVLDNFDTGAGKFAPFTEYLIHLANLASMKEFGCKTFGVEEGIHVCRSMDWAEETEVWFDDAYDRWMW